MNEIVLEHVPSVFLVHEYFTYYVSEKVRGRDALLNSFERRFYKYVWLAE